MGTAFITNSPLGSNNAAGYQLATGDPVMAIGGFNGTEPAPTLAQFQAYVAAGRIHWFVGGAGAGGNTGTAGQIAAWVASTFQSTSVGGATLYDLTGPMRVHSGFRGNGGGVRNLVLHDAAMSTIAPTDVATATGSARIGTVDIVVPVYNEEAGLERSVRRLHAYLDERFPLSWTIIIADNASTDRTWAVAQYLARRLPGVRAVHLDRKGRGRALRAAWLASPSPVVAYMDVDLSTDLDALLPLVAPLVSGHSDVAIGTRLAPDARVVRGPKRELISRSYNLLLKATLHNGFSDAQCGFKAVRRDVAETLLPLVEDEEWFFDTELLVLAERNGFRIHEVPVDWVDDPDSRVDVVRTAAADLHGVWRLVRRITTGRISPGPERPLEWGGRRPATPPADVELAGQLARFASVGVVSTLLFAALVAVLAGPLGLLVADLVALGVCSVANTAANRRLTFSLQGRAGRARQYAGGLALAGLPVALTVGAIAALELFGVGALWIRVTVLAAASAGAAAGRFVALRRWVFPVLDRSPHKETP